MFRALEAQGEWKEGWSAGDNIVQFFIVFFNTTCLRGGAKPSAGMNLLVDVLYQLTSGAMRIVLIERI